jgi:hypothetical protein
MDLAKKNRQDPAAADALLWVIQHTVYWDVARTRAVETLLRDHSGSEKLVGLFRGMSFEDETTEKFLRAAIATSSRREVAGEASLALAQYLTRRVGKKAEPEIEGLYERILDKYADIKQVGAGAQGTLGDVAKRALFEMRHLIIGQPVPDIEGEDLDGKHFKLSDYRGKVVMLYFWGDW